MATKPEDVKPSDLGYTENERDEMSVKEWREKQIVYTDLMQKIEAMPAAQQVEAKKAYDEMARKSVAIRAQNRRIASMPPGEQRVSAMDDFDAQLRDPNLLFADKDHPGLYLPKEIAEAKRKFMDDFLKLQTEQAERDIKFAQRKWADGKYGAEVRQLNAQADQQETAAESQRLDIAAFKSIYGGKLPPSTAGMQLLLQGINKNTGGGHTNNAKHGRNAHPQTDRPPSRALLKGKPQDRDGDPDQDIGTDRRSPRTPPRRDSRRGEINPLPGTPEKQHASLGAPNPTGPTTEPPLG